jgi:hypothetical protein
MSRTTNFIWKALNVISWIIFVGLCIQAAGFMIQTVATLLLTPTGASKFWNEIDISAVYDFNESRYVTLASLIIIVTILKVILFYKISMLFHNKNLNLSKVFNETLRRFILFAAYLALGIGFFAALASDVVKNIKNEGIALADLTDLTIAGADVWFFMGIILLIIGYVFKKGIELQTENELTI